MKMSIDYNDIITFVYFNSPFGGRIPAIGVDAAKFEEAAKVNSQIYITLALKNMNNSYDGIYVLSPSALDATMAKAGLNGTRRVKYVRLHDFVALSEKLTNS